MQLHDKIRDIIESTPGLTQKGLAERMGLNPAAVNRMLYGRRNIMVDELPVIEAYLGTRLDIYAQPQPNAAGPVPRPTNAMPGLVAQDVLLPVPVYTYLPEGGRRLTDWAQRHPAQAGIEDGFAVYVTTSAMEPRYFTAEIVYLHPTRPAQAGRDCLVETSDGHAVLGRLAAQGADGAAVTLEFYNPPSRKTFKQDEIAAIYTVLGRG